MRTLILKKLKEDFDGGYLTNRDDDEITDFVVEVEALSDVDLLDLYTWSVEFQG